MSLLNGSLALPSGAVMLDEAGDEILRAVLKSGIKQIKYVEGKPNVTAKVVDSTPICHTDYLKHYNGCRTCYTFSMLFGGCDAGGLEIRNDEQFEIIKAEFVQHFNENHQDIIKQNPRQIKDYIKIGRRVNGQTVYTYRMGRIDREIPNRETWETTPTLQAEASAMFDTLRHEMQGYRVRATFTADEITYTQEARDMDRIEQAYGVSLIRSAVRNMEPPQRTVSDDIEPHEPVNRSDRNVRFRQWWMSRQRRRD